MNMRVQWLFIVHTMAVLLVVASASAAELQVATLSSDPQTIEVSFTLYAPGQSVSSVQFDVTYDTAVLRILSVQPTDAIGAQSKQLLTSHPETGILRLLITGMNTYPLLNSGLAAVVFTVAGSAEAAGVRVTNIKAANPAGDEIVVIAVRPPPVPASPRRVRRR